MFLQLTIGGAIGLILPAAVHIAPVLVPIAAVGLVGAATVHARRKESPMVAVNTILLVFAAVIAWARFGPYSFGG